MSVNTDGDGWVETPVGPRWGLFGAAGLLLYHHNISGEVLVLMQHRAAWVAQGGLWALPGGAIKSTETATQAALREAEEEAGIPQKAVTVDTCLTTAIYGSWSYTTVIGSTENPLIGQSNLEAIEHRWVPIDEVASFTLLPDFQTAWPTLYQSVKELLA